MNRQVRSNVAQQTLSVLETGTYTNKQGNQVNIQKQLTHAIKNSVLYWDYEGPKIEQELVNSLRNKQIAKFKTQFEVLNETTLQAAQRIFNEGVTHLVCLNFASAKKPGGGFLSGSQAQEESLARSSGLYACLLEKFEMYEANRQIRSSLYTDHIIYSPDVPVFRADNGELLDDPFYSSFITAPAVNVGRIADRHGQEAEEIESTFLRRIERVLSIALLHGNEVIVLGAWGCGVFKNDPVKIADYFARFLVEDGRFVGCFRKAVFAIPQGNGHLEIFQNRFRDFV